MRWIWLGLLCCRYSGRGLAESEIRIRLLMLRVQSRSVSWHSRSADHLRGPLELRSWRHTPDHHRPCRRQDPNRRRRSRGPGGHLPRTLRQDQRRGRERLRRRAERTALPRIDDGSDHTTCYSDKEAVGLELTHDGLPIEDRRVIRQSMRVSFQTYQRRISMFTMQFQSVRTAERVSSLWTYPNSVYASGSKLSPSISLTELD